jgi:hypothetical protein
MPASPTGLASTSKAIYLSDLRSDPHAEAVPPIIRSLGTALPEVFDFNWVGLLPLLVDAGFSAIHNILPFESLQHRLGLSPSSISCSLIYLSTNMSRLCCAVELA